MVSKLTDKLSGRGATAAVIPAFLFDGARQGCCFLGLMQHYQKLLCALLQRGRLRYCT